MKIQLKKIGNSRGFTLPTQIIDQLGWNEQTNLELELTESGLKISKGIPDLMEMLGSVQKGLPDTEKYSRKLIGKELSE